MSKNNNYIDTRHGKDTKNNGIQNKQTEHAHSSSFYYHSSPSSSFEKVREPAPLIIVIAGPTAVGKSAVASVLCSHDRAARILLSQNASAIATANNDDDDDDDDDNSDVILRDKNKHDETNNKNKNKKSSNAETNNRHDNDESKTTGTRRGGGIRRGHVISADSVQAYAGLNIGANKPTREERSETPHHLIDIIVTSREEEEKRHDGDGIDVYRNTKYNAADWMRDAVYVIQKLLLFSGRHESHMYENDNNNDDDDEIYDDEDDLENAKAVQMRRKVIRKGITDSLLDDVDASSLSNSTTTSSDTTTTAATTTTTASAVVHGRKNQSILPVVVGGTMMYIQWLVHGRPDAMKPSKEAVEHAERVIREFQALDHDDTDATNNEANRDDDDDTDEKSMGADASSSSTTSVGWEAAITHASSLGPIFKSRVERLSSRDWYRLRRTLEVAYTVGVSNNDEVGKGSTSVVIGPSSPPTQRVDEERVNALYSGRRYDGLETLGYDVRCFFLCPDDRMKHTEVIDLRCEEMLLRGLLKETADLYLSGRLPDDGQPARAIGYRQTLDYLRRSDARVNDKEAFNAYIDNFTTATRRYAKKQMQWFRRDDKFLFVPISLAEPAQRRVKDAANFITEMCLLKREDFEKELINGCGTDQIEGEASSVSARMKLENEKQGKGMKFYMPKRFKLVEGSLEYAAVLAEADECTIRVREARQLLRKS